MSVSCLLIFQTDPLPSAQVGPTVACPKLPGDSDGLGPSPAGVGEAGFGPDAVRCFSFAI